jgi:hypothetical protein
MNPLYQRIIILLFELVILIQSHPLRMQIGRVKYDTFFPLLTEFLLNLILCLPYVVVGVHHVVIGAFVEVRFLRIDKVVEIERHVTEFAPENFQRVLLQENVIVLEISKIYRTRLVFEKGVSN